jgi:putative two-component system response regulator
MTTQSPHILFVDDELAVLQSMVRFVRRRQPEWQTQYATSVDEALIKLKSASFDAVISDIKMPGRDGFDLLRSLHSDEHTQDIPVVMVTGLSDHELKRKALELGATDLLIKPVDADELLARISSVLQLKAYQDEIKSQNKVLEQKVYERTLELENSRVDLIWRMGKAGEYRDSETGNHVIRVGYYSRIIAEAMGMDRTFVGLLFLTSPLHDIGKIGIPDSILLKAGRLSEGEWGIMKQHCQIGAELLGNRKERFPFESSYLSESSEQKVVSCANPFLEMASTIAFSHHERWQGTGYPNGLKHNNIPLVARIVLLADIYDALFSERPYKPAYGEEEVLSIMAIMANEHFDPEVYLAFQRMQGEFKEIRNDLKDNNNESYLKNQNVPGYF